MDGQTSEVVQSGVGEASTEQKFRFSLKPLNEKPAQWPDGTWRDPYGEVVSDPTISEDSPLESLGKPEEPEDPDRLLLQGLSQRALQKHTGKYTSTMLGTNQHPEIGNDRPYLSITPEETAASQRLLAKAQELLKSSQGVELLWTTLQTQLAKRQQVLGYLNEDINVVEDPTATTITSEDNDAMTIRVPSNVRRLYVWTNIIGKLEDDLRDMSNGTAQNRSAQQFGERLFQTQAFIDMMK